MGVSKPFLRKGAKTYTVTVRPGDGRPYQVSLGTRDETKAGRMAAALALDVDAGRWKTPQRAETLERFIDRYGQVYVNAAGTEFREARTNAWRTERAHLVRIAEFLRAVATPPASKVRDVTHRTAKEFIEARLAEAKLSVETVKHAVRVAKAAWNWAIGHELAASNPWCGHKFPKTVQRNPRNLSEFEIKKLFARLESGKHSYALRAIVATALYAGLRLGEILHLEWPDLDWTGGTISVRCDPTFTTKDREPRTTLFPPELRAILEPIKQAAGLVFPGRDGKPRRVRSLEKTVERLSTRAAVSFTLHDLRRTFAGHLARSGVPVPRIRDYLGHASTATTESYYMSRNDDADARDGAALTFGVASAKPSAQAKSAQQESA